MILRGGFFFTAVLWTGVWVKLQHISHFSLLNIVWDAVITDLSSDVEIRPLSISAQRLQHITVNNCFAQWQICFLENVHFATHEHERFNNNMYTIKRCEYCSSVCTLLFLRCELMCSAPVLNVRFMNKQHPASLIILAPDCFFMNQLDQSGLYKPCSPHWAPLWELLLK